MKPRVLQYNGVLIRMVLGASLVAAATAGSHAADFGAPARVTSEPVRAQGAPAQQFAFLIGKWRADQIYPALKEEIPLQIEEWKATADGSLVGSSYAQGAADPSEFIEIRLTIEGGRYIHSLVGASFTKGRVLQMPVVQVSDSTVVSVNAFGHRPVRTSYDLLADGSIVGAIYTQEEGQYTIWRMTKL